MPFGPSSDARRPSPQPTNTPPSGSSCVLPSANESTLAGWVNACTIETVRARSSTSSTSAREKSRTFGVASLSKSVIVPSDCRRASCCQAKRTPSPSAKSLRRPPSRHNTSPVLLVDLVQSPGVARRDEQVAVGLLLDRVDVEVVHRRLRVLRHVHVGFADPHVIERVPIPEDLAGGDVDLLDDAVQDLPAAGGDGVIDADQRRPARGQLQLVQVALQPVAGLHPRDLVVGLVGDDPRSRAVAGLALHLALPPGQHRLALVALDAEVVRGLARGRGLEPQQPAVGVEDRRAALIRAALGGDQDVGVGVAAGGEHRRMQVGPREEVLAERRLRGGHRGSRRGR